MPNLNIVSRGIPFNVHIVNKGDQYGLKNGLTHNEEEPLVEFYDARYPHTELGQFVSRYYLTTLLDKNKDVGLDLDGGIPDWKIQAKEMNEVIEWLEKIPYKPTNSKKFKF